MCHVFQVIENIFLQIDEENSGYISSEQLLSIIQSFEEPSDPSQATLIETLKVEPSGSHSNSPSPLQTFSNSPPLLPEYEGQKLKLSSYNINLFSVIDHLNSG